MKSFNSFLSLLFVFAIASNAWAYRAICEDISKTYGQCECKLIPNRLARHCPWDICPISSNDATNTLIIREDYTLSANPDWKTAEWIAYKVIPGLIGSGNKRNWKKDSCLDPSVTLTPANATMRPADYLTLFKGLPKFDRGHAAPLLSFGNSPAWEKVNYLSNITPQSGTLNRGLWCSLEGKARKLSRISEDVFVLTGPLYEYANPSDGFQTFNPRGEQIRIPTGYWKIIVHRSKKTSPWSVGGFIMPQAMLKGELICRYHVPDISEISRRSNLNVLPNKPGKGTVNEQCIFYESL